MNYHDRAEWDIIVAKLLLLPENNPTNDEALTDYAAYHTQQAIEKELKHILHDIIGADDTTKEFKTHNIADLISQIEERGYGIPDTIKEIAHDLSEWEAGARYSINAIAQKNEIKDAINNYYKLVERSQVIEKYIDDVPPYPQTKNKSEQIKQQYIENSTEHER